MTSNIYGQETMCRTCEILWLKIQTTTRRGYLLMMKLIYWPDKVNDNFKYQNNAKKTNGKWVMIIQEYNMH